MHDVFFECAAGNLHRHGTACACLDPEPSVQMALGWVWVRGSDQKWYALVPIRPELQTIAPPLDKQPREC